MKAPWPGVRPNTLALSWRGGGSRGRKKKEEREEGKEKEEEEEEMEGEVGWLLTGTKV